MSDDTEGLVVVQVTRDKALVWTTGVDPQGRPLVIRAPSEKSHHVHVREAQHHHGHDTDHQNTAYYESISRAVADASGIVLVGHGKGKANEMLRLAQYWERKHPDIGAKVNGAIDSNLDALSESQVLALVREWLDEDYDLS
ncbi:MAG: hypothetical protein WCA31_12645 [Acidimicrobiales bacterium]